MFFLCFSIILYFNLHHTPPTQSSGFTSYISLYNHPGVGQTHVSLGAKELEALLQIPLCVVINLRKQNKKRKAVLEEKIKILQQTLVHLCEFSLDVIRDVLTFCIRCSEQLVSIFFLWEQIIWAQVETHNHTNSREKLLCHLSEVKEQKLFVIFLNHFLYSFN